MTKHLKAIIIKGNPKYINNDLARKYYKDIETFLKQNGVSVVEFNDGEAFTIPKLDADIYIAHSRGTDRYEHMPKDKKEVFLKFGVIGGIIDPIDLKWQKEVWTKDTDKQPPKEHFILIDKQKEAILNLIKKINNPSLENFTNNKIHGFKRIESTSVNINKYKSQYHGLSHIRSGYGYDGVILIDKDDKFVAVLQCHITDNMIQAIDVSPDYRRQGIASSLLRIANKEFDCYKLTVRKNNVSAVALYEKHGYKTYKEDGIMLFMEKKNVSTEDLTDLITIPQEILDQANEDPILSGYINKTIQRVGIYFGDRVVGFYSPVEEEYKGKLYWRTGNIYILPEYRNKGLASKTILEFFSDKPFGMAHVAKNNPASLRAFEKNGFIKQDDDIGLNPKGKKLFLMLKEPGGLNFSFSKW